MTPEIPGAKVCAAAIGLVGLIAAAFLGVTIGRFVAAADSTTTTSLLSPDDRVVARLRESELGIDRNFVVELVDPTGHRAPTAVFSSPDEGRPVGSERFVWSTDSRYLLLIGRHFHIEPTHALPNGEQLYLLHDTATGQTWCNSEQQALPSFDRNKAMAVGVLPD